MARRNATTDEMLDETSVTLPTTGDAPGASEVKQGEVIEEPHVDSKFADSAAFSNVMLLDVEHSVGKDRTRQTLIGAMLVTRAIIFAGWCIADAIRDSRKPVT